MKIFLFYGSMCCLWVLFTSESVQYGVGFFSTLRLFSHTVRPAERILLFIVPKLINDIVAGHCLSVGLAFGPTFSFSMYCPCRTHCCPCPTHYCPWPTHHCPYPAHNYPCPTARDRGYCVYGLVNLLVPPWLMLSSSVVTTADVHLVLALFARLFLDPCSLMRTRGEEKESIENIILTKYEN